MSAVGVIITRNNSEWNMIAMYKMFVKNESQNSLLTITQLYLIGLIQLQRWG